VAEEKCEGIILKSYAYKETERILHLFTKDLGIIHLVIKHLSPRKPQRINLATPLCQGQYVLRKGKSDLFSFLDGSIIDLHLPLRQTLLTLETGGRMLRAIHDSQLPEKPAPLLYKLLSLYLKKLPLGPQTLLTSFQLKLLIHEGLISFEKPHLNYSGGTLTLNAEEWPILFLLAHGRDFETLISLSPSQELQKTVKDLFSSFIKN